jgi:hypothetical protein
MVHGKILTIIHTTHHMHRQGAVTASKAASPAASTVALRTHFVAFFAQTHAITSSSRAANSFTNSAPLSGMSASFSFALPALTSSPLLCGFVNLSVEVF